MKSAKELPYRNNSHSGHKLISQLNNIPSGAVAVVAELFENIARELRTLEQVYDHYQQIEENTKRRLFELKQIPVEIDEKLQDGMTFDDAVDYLSNYKNLPKETIYSYWLKHIKRTENKARKVRDKNIIKLYDKGISTAIIADIVDLSPRSVQRIIRSIKNADNNWVKK